MEYKHNGVIIEDLEDYLLNELFDRFKSHNGVLIFKEEHMHKTINWFSEYVDHQLHKMYGIDQKGE